MVLVHGIVAVRRVPAQEVAKSHEDRYFIVGPQLYHVFPGYLMRCRRLPVPREDLKFLQMNVDGVGPATATVLQDPDLRGALLRSRADFVHVKEFVVDRPGSLMSLEFPPPNSRHLS